MAKKASRAALQAALADQDVLNLTQWNVDFKKNARFKELNTKEGYFRCTAYDNRPYDWNGKLRVDLGFLFGPAMSVQLNDAGKPPVALRKPCAPVYMGRIIANRFVAILVGERRFPRPRVPRSAKTEAYLTQLMRVTQMKAIFTEAMALGGSTGSVLVGFKVVEGKFRLEVINSKWVEPVWEDFATSELKHFVYTYPYSEEQYDKQEKRWVKKWFIYRRIVTPTMDILFEPQPAKLIDGDSNVVPMENTEPEVNEEESFEHGFGFNPFQFIQNLPRYDQVDGDSVNEGAYDLFDRISENMSAIHSAMQGNLDPTLVLKITPEDYKKLAGMGGVVQTGNDDMALVVGDKGDAKFIEVTCENLKVAMEVVEKLKSFALDECDCVIADPHRITGAAQSAAAITKLYAPMLAKADILRNQYGENGIVRLLAKMLRAFFCIKNRVEVSENGLKRYKLLPLTSIDPETGKPVTVEPEEDVTEYDVALQWGEYFEPTTADVFQAVEASVMAAGNKPVTSQENAAKYAAPYLHDHDVATTVQDLEREEKEAQAHELALAEKGAKPAAKPAMQAKPRSNPQSSSEDDA